MISNKETILITGGSGLVGRELTSMLKDKYTITWVGRSKNESIPVKQYLWDPLKGTMDPEAIANADYIINLAGENLAAHRWTEKNKQRFIDSRVKSSLLLQNKLQEIPNKVQAIICSSAIGIYNDSGEKWQKEESKDLSDDYLGITVKQWESENQQFSCRTVILRIGIVLSTKGGAFPQLYRPLFTGAAPVFGKGKHYQSWIHIQDLCRMIQFALEEKAMSGIFNAVAPNPVTYYDFMDLLQKTISWPTIKIPVPDFFLKILLGEKAVIVLKGGRISCESIVQKGFLFKYPELSSAFKQLLNK
jgi:uncharacterized protein